MQDPRFVLLAEDLADLRKLFSIALSQAGLRVIEAANGSQAIEIAYERAKSNPPQPLDALVTNIVMPGADGLAVASACKHLYPDIAIVIVSGMPNGNELPVNLSGAVFLAKPFAPSSLVTAVERSLEKSIEAGD